MVSREPTTRRTLATLVTLIIVGVLLMTFDVRNQGGGLVTVLRTGTQTLMAPLQKAASFVVTPVVAMVESISSVANLREENIALRQELLEAQAQLNALQDVQVRVELLEQIFDLRTSGIDLGRTVANVIGRPDALDGALIIDKGTSHGIAMNQPVVDPFGSVVGTVRSVTPWTATVVPITATRQGLTVLVGDQEGSLISQTGSETMRLESLTAREAVLVGDRVLTSAGSLRFPSGLPVGEVIADAAPTVDGLTAMVRPFVNPDLLRLVVVLAWPPDPVSAAAPPTTSTTTSTTIPEETTTTAEGD